MLQVFLLSSRHCVLSPPRRQRVCGTGYWITPLRQSTWRNCQGNFKQLSWLNRTGSWIGEGCNGSLPWEAVTGEIYFSFTTPSPIYGLNQGGSKPASKQLTFWNFSKSQAGSHPRLGCPGFFSGKDRELPLFLGKAPVLLGKGVTFTGSFWMFLADLRPQSRRRRPVVLLINLYPSLTSLLRSRDRNGQLPSACLIASSFWEMFLLLWVSSLGIELGLAFSFQM